MHCDLEADPYQLRNLADDPALSNIRDGMELELGRCMERTGDSWPYDWSRPIEDCGRFHRYVTFCEVVDFMEWAEQNPDLSEVQVPGGQ